MKKKIPFLLLAIFILALGLRVYELAEFPVGFHIDEAQIGYNAYSLLKTGKDEFGNFLSHHLNIFGYSRPTALFYLTMPSIAILGLNELATRLPTAILGVLMVVAFYFLVKLIFRDTTLGLISSLLLSISPWHIIFSRASTENILELLLVVGGTYFLFYGLRVKKSLYFLISYLFFVFAYFSYLPSRVFGPLFLFGFGLIFFKDLKKEKLLKRFLLVFIFYLVFPIGLFMVKREAISRFKQVGIFTNPGVQMKIDEQIREMGQVPPLITRLFHNKVINYSLAFFENYQEYFTGKFLFTLGGFPMRFRIPQMGVLYFFEFPLLIWGFLHFVQKKEKGQIFVIYWLLIAPIAASLTVEDTPNFQRVLLLVPPLVILVASGIGQTLKFFKKIRLAKLAIIGLGCCYLYGLSFFLLQYFVHQKVHRPWYRMDEMKELVNETARLEDKYEKIIMTKNSTEPYIFFLFYQTINPVDWHKVAHRLDWEKNWSWGKYEFIGEDCPLAIEELEKNKKYLHIEKGECIEYRWKKIIKEIKRPDGSLALRLVEINLPEYVKWKEKGGLKDEN